MKALLVLALLMGVMSMLAAHINVERTYSAPLIALNYAVFRQAALLHAHKHKPEGEIAAAALSLPLGWRALRSWKARVHEGVLYVYGPASAQEIDKARQVLRNSMSVGRAEGGRLVPQWGEPVSIPVFVPEGNLASAIEVK